MLNPTVQQELSRAGQPLMTVLDDVWDFPPAQVEVPSDVIHVWRASLDPPIWHLERLMCILSEAEQARARQFYFEGDRKRFVVARGLLRVILGSYLEISPDRLLFHYGPAGKPVLSDLQVRQEIQFSVSHSHGLVLYAVTGGRHIGIDLERIRPILNAAQITQRVFSPREHALFWSLPPIQRQAAFFYGWTRKEAYVKACGDGLARPLTQIDVSLPPFEPARPLCIEGQPQESSRWSIQHLTPAPRYVAAVVIEGNIVPLTCWQWPEWL